MLTTENPYKARSIPQQIRFKRLVQEMTRALTDPTEVELAAGKALGSNLDPANVVTKPSWISTLVSVAIVVASLYLARSILIPLTLATLLSFMLSPLCHWLETKRIGRVPAVLLTAFLGFSVIGIMIWMAVVQIIHLEPQLPAYKHNLEEKLTSLNAYSVEVLSKLTAATEGMGSSLGMAEPATDPLGTTGRPFAVRIIAPTASPLQLFGGVYSALFEVLATTGIVLVLVVFFLVRREDLRDRFIHLVGKAHLTLTTQMLEDASKRVARYLSMLFVINVAFGLSVGVGLYFIGVPNAVLWGILAAFLRFIPYIGPWIAAVMPIALSMAISSGWTAPMLTVSLFVVLELFNNNLLEPWVYGRNTGVSAVAVLLAAIFWMWLWGPVGLLLATPLTVCILVVGKHIPQLSSLDVLLGTEPAFDPKTRLYQRLLAGDPLEAAEVFEEFLKDSKLANAYDTVLIPALATVETHWQLGDLSDRKYQFILQSLRELIEDHANPQDEGASSPAGVDVSVTPRTTATEDRGPGRQQLSIVCLPARSEADEITASMLAQILEGADCTVQLNSVASLATLETDVIEKPSADFFFISATPPVAMMHARHLCRKLRIHLPRANLIVGLWGIQGDLDNITSRIGFGSTVVRSLTEAQGEIQRLRTAVTPQSPVADT